MIGEERRNDEKGRNSRYVRDSRTRMTLAAGTFRLKQLPTIVEKERQRERILYDKGCTEQE